MSKIEEQMSERKGKTLKVKGKQLVFLNVFEGRGIDTQDEKPDCFETW